MEKIRNAINIIKGDKNLNHWSLQQHAETLKALDIVLNFASKALATPTFSGGETELVKALRYLIDSVVTQSNVGGAIENAEAIISKFLSGEKECKHPHRVEIEDGWYCMDCQSGGGILPAPQLKKECEHEWRIVCVGAGLNGCVTHINCLKCGKNSTEVPEPKPKDRIEELEIDEENFKEEVILAKINELIRHINKES